MHFINLSTGGTIFFEFPTQPDSGSISVKLYAPNGSGWGAPSVTPDTVNTTITGTVGPGSQTLGVNTVTGLVAGRRYLLDGPETVGGESITVKAVSGSSVTLFRPVITAHLSGSSLKGTGCLVSLTGSQTGTVGRGYRGEAFWTLDGVAQHPVVFSFHLVRYSPVSYLTMEDVRDLDPTLASKLPKGAFFSALRDKTWNMILNRVASTVNPGAVVGTVDLTVAHSFLVRSELALTAGPDFIEYRTQMAQRFAEELEAALAACTVDTNEDGIIAANEAFRRVIHLVRG